MLRNRSRAVTSKQALMADHSSQRSQNYYTTKIPSFFGSPRFRAFFTIKGSHSETDQNPMISPTSILDTKLSLPFGNHFSCDKNQPSLIPKALSGNKRSWDNSEVKGIGLALVDTLIDEKFEVNSSSACKESNGNKVLFGTKLRVQIPPYPAKGSSNSGIQTENSNSNSNSPQAFSRCVSVREMELSEDYTCVISRGPNPRTTHIFDNCIVESYYTLSDSGHLSKSAPENFLSFCHTCKKNLEQNIDIYIYRGDKAFCSHECRYQEMLLDEKAGNPEF
ncbi:putative Zf-FLZ domain-containing protein [Rosa chinensis]|uniref:Putative Zf-FLZ domain-containing protein n=1 Tax=Rosa chinensis TaxID=74649 RepID=A0A2P6PVW3_ROSCH|nr:FCS-Like Zinc finger 8 [Rosa chinensis]PRQ26077.1 putative Zf-FLZ domain-containing protein [Rosa chinensis]